MGAPPRRAPSERGVAAFALPWPIYPRTILPRVGVFALKRGGGRGSNGFDGQVDGQIPQLRHWIGQCPLADSRRVGGCNSKRANVAQIQFGGSSIETPSYGLPTVGCEP